MMLLPRKGIASLDRHCCSHFSRPGKKQKPGFSLAPIAVTKNYFKKANGRNMTLGLKAASKCNATLNLAKLGQLLSHRNSNDG